MKVVILAGGLGTRLSEETDKKPKPMVEIGGLPIIWHIMKLYSHYGHNDFIICCGYKGYILKEYFSNYALHTSDITINFSKNETIIHRKQTEPWNVTLVDTGEITQTGGRLARVAGLLEKEKSFCMTYGDGVADINIDELVACHKSSKKIATMTVVRPPARYGAVEINSEGDVTRFAEKPDGEGDWINGGFFVLNSGVFNFIDGDATIWERQPLELLCQRSELNAFQHTSFWQAMDTLREKNMLDTLWSSNNAPWKVWK